MKPSLRIILTLIIIVVLSSASVPLYEFLSISMDSDTIIIKVITNLPKSYYKVIVDNQFIKLHKDYNTIKLQNYITIIRD